MLTAIVKCLKYCLRWHLGPIYLNSNSTYFTSWWTSASIVSNERPGLLDPFVSPSPSRAALSGPLPATKRDNDRHGSKNFWLDRIHQLSGGPSSHGATRANKTKKLAWQLGMAARVAQWFDGSIAELANLVQPVFVFFGARPQPPPALPPSLPEPLALRSLRINPSPNHTQVPPPPCWIRGRLCLPPPRQASKPPWRPLDLRLLQTPRSVLSPRLAAPRLSLSIRRRLFHGLPNVFCCFGDERPRRCGLWTGGGATRGESLVLVIGWKGFDL